MKAEGIVISGLRGGSGKTIVSVGLTAALIGRGQPVAPFKKGPDYIDAGWLGLAADRPCFNLDSFLLSPQAILESYQSRRIPGGIAVVEGNRGLFDCINTEGLTSTAELAKLLGLPVLLIIDGTKTTRTMAAVVGGCAQFDPDVNIAGVVLNRVAGKRHEGILRRSIETHCGIPVVGAIPKLTQEVFPERHMGLVPTPEHGWAGKSIATAGRIIADHLDLDRILRMAQNAPGPAHPPASSTDRIPERATAQRPRIGVIQDSAFQFYYPENIEALRREGAEVEFCSPLEGGPLPDVDGLYIGGGFPETHAAELAANEAFRRRLKQQAEAGLPIYAECGGLMFLGRQLVLDSGTYPMSGVLPLVFGLSRRPQGHGYTIVEVDRGNPYYDEGLTFRGHEFHYSRVLEWNGRPEDLVFTMRRGRGIVDGRDGACYRNVLATYTHIHALGLPQWAAAMVRCAAAFACRTTPAG